MEQREANISSVSANELKQRRQALKSQRRLKTGQAMWRSLLVSGITAGLLWGLARSHWGLWHSSQIQIEGNQFLSEEELRALLPIQYPQSLLRFSAPEFIEQLKAQTPVFQASATRQLFPPTLILNVKDRPPVAIAISPGTKTAGSTQLLSQGWLDETGTIVPSHYYQSLGDQFTLPTLKVMGVYSQYHQDWPALYQAIRQTSLEIIAVDWRDTTNLILKTSLADAHFGPFSQQFPAQLQALVNLGDLSRHIPSQQIAFINLLNPDAPAVQLK